jgi:hypothetical protein
MYQPSEWNYHDLIQRLLLSKLPEKISAIPDE